MVIATLLRVWSGGMVLVMPSRELELGEYVIYLFLSKNTLKVHLSKSEDVLELCENFHLMPLLT